jgi:CRISPR-associated protein Csd1
VILAALQQLAVTVATADRKKPTPPLYAWRPVRWVVRLLPNDRHVVRMIDTRHPRGEGFRVGPEADVRSLNGAGGGEYNAIDHLIDVRREATPWDGTAACCPMNGRTNQTEARLIADCASYVFGVTSETSKSDRSREHMASYRELVAACLSYLDGRFAMTGADPAERASLAAIRQNVAAVAQFVNRDEADLRAIGDAFADDMQHLDVVNFEFAGSRDGPATPIDLTHPAIVKFWGQWCRKKWTENGLLTSADSRDLDSQCADRQCHVCGAVTQLMRIWPQKIKGVPDTQPSGAALSSADDSAYQSWGYKSGFNAPVCLPCADALARTVNDLFRSRYLKIQAGQSLLVYWDDDVCDLRTGELIRFPTVAAVRELRDLTLAPVDEAAARRRASDEATGWRALFLTGRSGRIVVRSWHETTLHGLRQNLDRWFSMQAAADRTATPEPPLPIVGYWRPEGFGHPDPAPLPAEPAPRGTAGGRPQWTDGLLESLVRPSAGRRSIDDIPPAEITALIRAAMTGSPVPLSLGAKAVNRSLAEGVVTRGRAAVMCLTVLSRVPFSREEPMSAVAALDSPAYRLGRALAFADEIQFRSIGREPSASFSDRSLRIGCTAPQVMVGVVTPKLNAHIRKLNRRNDHWAWLAVEFNTLLPPGGELPTTFSADERCRFLVGFYHAKQELTAMRSR